MILGATLLAPFTPEDMKYCESSGALFHPVSIPKTQESIMGVLASSIAESLVHSIGVDEKGNYSIDWKGRRLPIAHEKNIIP